jgi:hypothetical protein
MQRQFEPPTAYYDERIKRVDENIAASIATRQHLSNGQPGFPKVAYLEQWARQYAVPIPILQQTFTLLFGWRETVRERVEPDQFERFVPIMTAEQQQDLLVTVPYLRQYNNCSVVEVLLASPQLSGPVQIDVEIAGYECQRHGGGGSRGYWRQEFVVTPVVPDDQAATLGITIHVESDGRMRRPSDEPAPQTIPQTTFRPRLGYRG